MSNPKIGILGSGDVGKALGAGFLRHGHDVKIGSREPKALSEWVRMAGARVSAGTFDEVAAFGDILVLATLGTGTLEALEMAGKKNFRGKVVMDATNPLRFSPNAAPALFVGTTDSLGEQVQRAVADARVVKVYNTVGHALMVNPELPGGPPDMFIAGNDDTAKTAVTEILTRFGWGTVDVGGIEMSRYLEPMCLVWVMYGIRTGRFSHAFKLLGK